MIIRGTPDPGQHQRQSAGLLAYRLTAAGPEVLLVHPGGPYWRNRDLGAWSIPKGEYDDGEDPLAAARRECREELGAAPEPGGASSSEPVPLTPVKQKGGKLVRAWAVAWDWDPAALASNTFTIEWPPRSRRSTEFPEADRAEWFTLAEAAARILESQRPLIEELARVLDTA
ncbi:MAG TPA: NUDIX domain-containing protein [Longimicrobiales bacterium]|nr:NUDIX domain-containing protein [Longimicrobiales bacterium]